MTDLLDLIGLAALTLAGFLIAIWVGFACLGGGCLVLSWSITSKARKAKEAELARRERVRL